MGNIDPNIDPNTILFVDACAEKWLPFTKNVDADRQGRLSYLCEREANYWKSELQKDGALIKQMNIGAKLKYVFPTLMKLNDRITQGETEFDQVWKTAEAALEDVFPEPVWCVWGMRDNRPSEKAMREFLSPFVERSHASLLAVETIVSRNR